MLALAAGYVLLIQAAATAVEIISRKVFNHSIQGANELGGYALAIAGAVGFGYAAVTCAHTRIDFVLVKLLPAGRAVLHQTAAVVLMVVAFGMFWYGLRTLRQSIGFGAISTTPLQTPLWIPQGLWVTGLGIFALLKLINAVHCLTMFARRDFAGIKTLMKAKSQEQQQLDAAGFGDAAPGDRP